MDINLALAIWLVLVILVLTGISIWDVVQEKRLGRMGKRDRSSGASRCLDWDDSVHPESRRDKSV